MARTRRNMGCFVVSALRRRPEDGTEGVGENGHGSAGKGRRAAGLSAVKVLLFGCWMSPPSPGHLRVEITRQLSRGRVGSRSRCTVNGGRWRQKRAVTKETSSAVGWQVQPLVPPVLFWDPFWYLPRLLAAVPRRVHVSSQFVSAGTFWCLQTAQSVGKQSGVCNDARFLTSDLAQGSKNQPILGVTMSAWRAATGINGLGWAGAGLGLVARAHY